MSIFRKMASKIPRLLLFDIDGTLTRSRHKKVGGSHGSSLLEALSITFNQNIERHNVQFAGGTDPTITRDVLEANEIYESNCENYKEKIAQAFEMLPQIAKKGIAEGRYQFHILPNVNELLQALAERSDVKIALLTGNIQDVALLKLQTAGVDAKVFMSRNSNELFGAFGSDNGDRSKLVEIAKQRYCKFLGVSDIDPNDMVVIGDTPKDISCAHDNGVPCIAVTTGLHSEEELANADFILENGFQDISSSVKAIVETCNKNTNQK